MPEALGLALALVALALTLGAAVLRPHRLPEAVVAAAGAAVLVAVGAIGWRGARHAVGALGPTVGFLAALLVLAEGCRREGLFEALGQAMARRAQGSARRLLGLVFAGAAGVTAVLGLDATVLLLTPVVLATAARARVGARPHVYACAHLANSASLLLVVSNLTNLLALHSGRLSFTRFAALMALPWLAVLGVEWVAFRRFFAGELVQGRRAGAEGAVAGAVPVALPRFPLAVLALTLAGFVASSPLHVAPVWFAVGGAVVLSLPWVARHPRDVVRLAGAAEPGFLLFVLGLGVIVAAATSNGLHSAVASVLPGGGSLPDLLGIAAVAAVLANLVNNLPATLILLPVTAGLGTGPLLAMLIGVGVGPNLTYTGSLATLLWRRVLRARGVETGLGEFTRLGMLTVPPAILLGVLLLWIGVRHWG